MRRLQLLLVFGLAGQAHATVINGVGGASVEYVSGGAIIRDGSGVSFQGRTWTQPVSRTAPLTVNEPLKIGVGGRVVAANAARTVTAGALGSAVLAVGAAGYTGWQVGTAIANYLDLGDQTGGTRLAPCGEGNWCFDAGGSTVAATIWSGDGNGLNEANCGVTVACGYSPADALEARRAQAQASIAQYGCTVQITSGPTQISATQWQAVLTPLPASPCQSNYMGQQTASVFPKTTTRCEPYIDALNPAFSNSDPKVGPDGKCPTGRYDPISLAQAKAKLAPTDTTWADGIPLDKIGAAAEDVLQRGGTIQGSERTMSGPASVSGTPQVTTENKPDGSTVTTTKTPVTNYTYNNNTINYTTTVTTTVNNNGSVTTTTTNTPGAETEADSECAKSPGTVGCMPVGDLPTDAPTWQSREVTFAAEDLGFGSGACPVPGSVELAGIPPWVPAMTLQWSYQPACDIAWLIRLAMLACAAVAAIFILTGSKEA